MKIKKMTAHFGALDGESLSLSEGLNVLYAPNESGKSTWCAFIRAMLYGISTSQRAKAGQKPDKVKYHPWGGTPMSGSMELETPAGPVTLRRWTERASQPMQAFSATVTGTDTPVKGLSADTAGETLTYMPREVFERSVFIRQAGLELTYDQELDRRIGAIVSSGDEEISFMETEDRLRKWRRRRSGRSGAIPALEQEIAKTEAMLRTIERETGEIVETERELASLEAAYDEAVRRMERARAEQRRRALSAMSENRARAEEAREAVRRAEAELKEAAERVRAEPYGDMGPEEAARRSEKDVDAANELRRLADKLPPVKLAYIPLALAAAAFLMALVLPWKVECAAVGCILVLLFVVMFTRLQGLRRTKEETLADRQRILDAYGVSAPDEITALLEKYRLLWKEKERASLRLEEAERARDELMDAQKRAEARTLDGLDFSRGDNDAARAGREAEEIRARIAALREKRAAIEGRAAAVGDKMVLESELAQARSRLEALRGQDEALALALETLSDADAELQGRFSPKLAKTAAAYFAQLTDGRYDELTLSRELAAKARPAGQDVGRETDYLSLGAKDQLYLALRLAVCELALPREDPCPIILDDALVSFDRARMERALGLIRGLAGTRQILLFTCHEREYGYFASDPAVTRIGLKG